MRLLLAAEKKKRITNEEMAAAGVEIVPEFVEIDDDTSSPLHVDVGETLFLDYIVEEPDTCLAPAPTPSPAPASIPSKDDNDYDDERTIASLLSLKEATPPNSQVVEKSNPPPKAPAKSGGKLTNVGAAVRVRTKVKHEGSHKLSRHAPIIFKNIIKNLSVEQADCSLLHFQMEQYDHKLLYHIGINYNADEPCISLSCGRLPVRSEEVHQIFGLSCGANPMTFASSSEYTQNKRLVAAEFPKVVSMSRIGLIDMCDTLSQMRNVSRLFKLIFL